MFNKLQSNSALRVQEPITWSLHLPYKPLESTLSGEKFFIEIAFVGYFHVFLVISNQNRAMIIRHTSSHRRAI